MITNMEKLSSLWPGLDVAARAFVAAVDGEVSRHGSKRRNA
jgi:hypothetical protein